MRGWVIRGLRAVADLLLPRVCVVCGCKLVLKEQHICPDCLDDMPRTRFHMLEHNPMADRFNDAIQRHLEALWDACPTESHPLERYAYASALFFYDNESDYRHIPQQIKYHDNISAGRFFGQMLGDPVVLGGHPLAAGSPYLVPGFPGLRRLQGHPHIIARRRRLAGAQRSPGLAAGERTHRDGIARRPGHGDAVHVGVSQ